MVKHEIRSIRSKDLLYRHSSNSHRSSGDDMKQKWTPEPWKVTPASKVGIYDIATLYLGDAGPLHVTPASPIFNTECGEAEADADRIVECVNGCAGLNPAAFRECVEFLKCLTAAIKADGYDKHMPDIYADAVEILAKAREVTA